ncbi:hypothetical protein QL285_088975 [Trifolium repens]|nr:hypothetical protein QL285_088975 [Trifolium repens]
MVARHHRQFAGVSPTWTCFSRFRRRFAVLPSFCSVFRPPCISVFRSCCSSTVFRFVLIRSGFHFSVFWCRSTVFIFLLVYGAMLFSLCFLCFRLVPCFSFSFFWFPAGLVVVAPAALFFRWVWWFSARIWWLVWSWFYCDQVRWRGGGRSC